jgi:hypothetical protein
VSVRGFTHHDEEFLRIARGTWFAATDGDTPKTLAVGSEVVIKIFAESECFAATAKVVYANSNSGMGLAFREVPLKSAALLRQWLQRASAVPNKSDS